MELKVPAEYARGERKALAYGTAGFRGPAEGMEWLVFRVGALGALRSGSVGGRAVGLMITASHNPVQDNGVKLCDPLGEMLDAAWEAHATAVAQATDEELNGVLAKIASAEGVALPLASAAVFGGFDTRPSSVPLHDAAKDADEDFEAGAEAAGATFTSHGLLSTPQLHYIVRTTNQPTGGDQPTEAGYYERFAGAFAKFLGGGAGAKEGGAYEPRLFVDAANGVGAPKLRKLIEVLEGKAAGALKVEVLNDGAQGGLNDGCGADYVKLHQKAPQGAESMCAGQRWASLDGDADRIVYYFVDGEGAFRLLDGDALAVLIAGWVAEQLKAAGLGDKVRLGVVQTAYANGASTTFLKEAMGITAVCVPTGVKHLHKAAESLDIGVYFEANGHGTVLTNVSLDGLPDRLQAFLRLANEAVGDALADMLLVEAVLGERGWDAARWAATYADLPNRQIKVAVADRTAIRTEDAERKVAEPAGLQAAVDEAVAGAGAAARAFVRPSGTEDCVRVYAEAQTREKADGLAESVKQVVLKFLSA